MMFISAAGDKLKSEADAALQAQMQRQERLAVSSMEAAEVTYECVLMEAKAGIKACESGDIITKLPPHEDHMGNHLALLKDDSIQACSCDFCCAAAERLEASQESSCEALQGSLQAAGLSITAAGAAVQQADQLAAGEHAAPWILRLDPRMDQLPVHTSALQRLIPCALCHQD